jgi:membrane protein
MMVLDVGVSFLFYGLLFTLVYRYLPAERVSFARAWRGGFLSAGFFVIGKQLIGSYLGGSALGSAYGAAGSIVVLLAWVYYSALITFVGAQMSALIQLKPRAQA